MANVLNTHVTTELNTTSVTDTWKIADASFIYKLPSKSLLSPVLLHENICPAKYQISVHLDKIYVNNNYCKGYRVTLGLKFSETKNIDISFVVEYKLHNHTARIHCNNIDAGLVAKQTISINRSDLSPFTVACTLYFVTHIHKSIYLKDNAKNVEVENISKPLEDDKQKSIYLSGMYKDSEFSDMTIYVKGKPFYIHINILSCYPYFEKLLLEGKRMGHTNIYIDDVEPDIFEYILQYIYTGDDKDLKSVALKSLNTIKKFGMDTLESKYLQLVQKNLTLHTLIDTSIVAYETNDQTLISSIKDFLITNIASVKKSEVYDDLKHFFPNLLLEILTIILSASLFLHFLHCYTFFIFYICI